MDLKRKNKTSFGFICPNCGKGGVVPGLECPHCHEKIPDTVSKWIIWLIVVLILAGIGLGTVFGWINIW